MFGKYIKNFTLYNQLIKLKPLWITHLSLISLLICEILTIIDAFVLHNEDPTADYIIEYSTAFAISHYIDYMLLGFLLLLYLFFQILIKLLFNKIFTTKNKFLLNNKIYHFFWTIGTYISIILIIYTLCYVLTLTNEGLGWLYEQFWK